MADDAEKARTLRSWLISIVIALVAVGLYVYSLFTETWFQSTTDFAQVSTGLDCLSMPLRDPGCLLNPAWWANGFFVLGLVALCRNRRETASMCGGTGLLLGSFLWLLSEILDRLIPFGVGFPLAGYYLWLGAMGVLTLSSCHCFGHTTSEPTRERSRVIRWFGRLPGDLVIQGVHLPIVTCVVGCSLWVGVGLLLGGLLWLIMKLVYFNL